MTDDELDTECRVALERLRHGAGLLGLTLTPEQEERYITYCSLLLRTNRHTNLTAVRDAPGVMTTLFLDALTLVPALQERLDLGRRLKVVDVGAGAGLPCLPLKILFPQWDITLVESVGKKSAFLRDVAAALELQNVTVLKIRAEEAAGTDLRDAADLAVARAVSALPSLVELCAPFTRPRGFLAFPKGGGVEGEINAARVAASRLGCRLLDVVPVSESLGLPPGRVVVMYEKTRPTPKGFPRRVGLAQKDPILR